MAHFISAISKMLDWNHAQRPPRQRLRSSCVRGSNPQHILGLPERRPMTADVKDR